MYRVIDLRSRCLSTLVVVADTKGTLGVEAVSPVSTDINVGLGDLCVGEKKPSAEDTLGKDIQNSVGDDLLVNGHLARAIGDTPDTEKG